MSQTKAELIKGLNINASAPATALNIDSSGRVGIGTTGPATQFAVQNASTSLGIEVDTTSGFASGPTVRGYYRAGSAYTTLGLTGSQVAFGINDVEKARLDASGRLLVGTSTSVGATPARMQIKGAAGGVAPFAKYSLVSAFDEDAGGIELSSSSSNSIVIQADPDNLRASSDISFRVDATERIKIAGSGGVFTSTTSLSDDFGVKFLSNSGNQYNLGLYKSTDQNTVNEDYIRGTGGATTRFKFVGNGGLYNYSANNSNLSDVNTKKDIAPAADTWNCVKQWEIVNYRYKNQPDDADLNLGVIAQQVAESCPEVITVFERATDHQPEKLGVKEQQMYWMAIKALQEAMERIATLQGMVAVNNITIDEQQHQISALADRLTALETV